jgi:hypothetical protein
VISSEVRRAAIEALEDSSGIVTPERVVDAARDPDHPLHDCFDWDMERAAREHWLDTARSLIREVKIRVRIERRVITSVAYVRDPRLPARQAGYVALTEAARRHDLSRDVLEAELDRCTAALTRARAVASVLGMAADLEDLLEATTQIRQRAQEAKPRSRSKRQQPGASPPP